MKYIGFLSTKKTQEKKEQKPVKIYKLQKEPFFEIRQYTGRQFNYHTPTRYYENVKVLESKWHKSFAEAEKYIETHGIPALRREREKRKTDIEVRTVDSFTYRGLIFYISVIKKNNVYRYEVLRQQRGKIIIPQSTFTDLSTARKYIMDIVDREMSKHIPTPTPTPTPIPTPTPMPIPTPPSIPAVDDWKDDPVSSEKAGVELQYSATLKLFRLKSDPTQISPTWKTFARTSPLPQEEKTDIRKYLPYLAGIGVAYWYFYIYKKDKIDE